MQDDRPPSSNAAVEPAPTGLAKAPRRAAASEIVWAYGGVALAVFGLTRLQTIAVLSEYVSLVVAWCLMTVSIRLAWRSGSVHGLRRFGLSLGGLLEPVEPRRSSGSRGAGKIGAWMVGELAEIWALGRQALPQCLESLGWALVAAALVFPAYIFGFFLWHQPEHAFVWHLPNAPLALVLGQIIVVALPEEAFFRGYLQTRLVDVWPSGRVIGKHRLHLGAWVTQALLFALLHVLVDLHPARLIVFFPGLAFGWLRVVRRGIGTAVFFHVLCNLLGLILVQGWILP